ncbi:Heme d1 biosynthesis protein NirH [hydrothermal vent metagenome]|uniref:siroheme decarboxylase n=1 Tax=hydrothermal vent metagenome TaxID=652676 RepID=A0A3B1BFE2_9ZZZZ
MLTTDHHQVASIDALDRAIIVATQSGLPLVPRPYDFLAALLEMPVDDLKHRLQQMQDSGIIRRIGVVPNHYALGYRANGMTVWDVPDELINQLGEQVGALEFVSHCYHRPRKLPDWPYNLFAMVHAHHREEAAEHIEHIAQLLGENNRRYDVLFSTRILKKTGMRIKP